MTTIAYRAGLLAADSQVTTESGVKPGLTVPKVQRVRADVLVGSSGLFAQNQLFLEWAMGVKHWDDLHGMPEWHNDFSGYVFCKRESGTYALDIRAEGVCAYWIEPDHYVAYGIGAPIALGCMWHGGTARNAIEAAVYHSVWSGGTITTVEF